MAEKKESVGRPASFWMSHEELRELAKQAEREGVTRNEVTRRAVRAYVGL